MTWDEAIEQARSFSRKWCYFDGGQERAVFYFMFKDRAFSELPARVKAAYRYLREVGEIN